ncbi:unnamed protein product [Paramecium primaurelia]|uniref:Uncharacterized protein n=1 Tax=Paramecium primaurelia TaxID=5886 RepID=A0A8S1JZ46_PARPR|nr:unnamed protein product [Paramecium primaurelia]
MNIGYGILVHQVIISICEVLSQQNQSIQQFAIDGYFIQKFFNSNHQMTMWRLFNDLGAMLPVFLKYFDNLLKHSQF